MVHRPVRCRAHLQLRALRVDLLAKRLLKKVCKLVTLTFTILPDINRNFIELYFNPFEMVISWNCKWRHSWIDIDICSDNLSKSRSVGANGREGGWDELYCASDSWPTEAVQETSKRWTLNVRRTSVTSALAHLFPLLLRERLATVRE